MNKRKVKFFFSIGLLFAKCCSLTASVRVTVEDLERNDGSAERPYFMSQNLLSLLNKSNEKPKSVD